MALDSVGGTPYLYVAEYNDGKVSAFNLSTPAPTPAGALTGFVTPNGILVDSATRDLIVTERTQNRVTRMTSAGAVVWRYGSEGTGAGQFRGPVGIARDSSGAIYIAEHDGNRVQKFTVGAAGLVPVTSGWPVTLPGTGYGITVDASNNVLVAVGAPGNRVLRFTSAGAAAGEIVLDRIVTGVTAAADGVYTTQTNGAGGNRVQRFPTAGGAANLTFGSDGELHTAFAVAVDSANNRAYVSSFGSNTVQIYSLSGGGSTDTTPPTVTVAVAPGATANSVTFNVTFSESVTGVAAGSFTATGAGGATASPLTAGSVTGSGANYAVTVNFTGTAGTVALGMSAAANTIKDASNNAFAGGGTTSATYTIPATATVPTVTSATSRTATVGTAFSYQITASGSPTSYAATGLAGTGLSIDTTTGVISGTPTAAGTITSQLTATNAAGTSAPVTLTITVAAGSTGSAPTITSATTRTATVGTAFTYQITATGSPTSYAATGLTGTGLSLNPTTGVISGTPAAAGTITSQLTATNATGTSAPVALTITVSPATTGSAPTITSATTATGAVGTAFSYQIVASGSPTGYAATGLAGTGLSLNATTGVISGTPTAAGTITSQLTATNATGTSTPVTLTITVGSAPAAGVEIDVTGYGLSIASGDTTPVAIEGTDMGSALVDNGTVTRSFSILNKGTVSLSIATPVTISGANAADFTVTTQPAAAVAAGASTAFTITFDPSAAGVRTATVSIANNDANENPYTFVVQGTGVANTTPPPPAGGGGGFTPPPVVNPPPTTTLQGQTVLFVSPVSAVLVGEPLALSATASSGLPVTFVIVSGNATMSGNTLTIHDVDPVRVRATQTGNGTYSAASTEITLTAQRRAQQLNIPGMSNVLTTDRNVALTATSSAGLPITYSLVSGPATLSGNTLTLTGRPGEIVINVTQAGSDAFLPASSQLRFNVDPAARLVNLSSRMNVSNDQPVIVGFVVAGTTDKEVLIRAVGPGLAAFNVAGTLSNPRLQVFDSAGRVVAENDDWNANTVTATADRVGAFRLTASSRDAAIVTRLAPGAYTVVVTGVNSNGVVLIEVYDAATREQIATQQLINISTRGFVGSGDDSLIAGFVVTGSAPKRVLVRGIGPGLTAFGVAGAISNPMLQVFAAGNPTPVAQNDNWGTGQSAADIASAAVSAGAFALTAGSNDAALVVTLNPGNYSAVITGAGNVTGTGLVEVYELPNP